MYTVILREYIVVAKDGQEWLILICHLINNIVLVTSLSSKIPYVLVGVSWDLDVLLQYFLPMICLIVSRLKGYQKGIPT